jgi:hypothetical protein
VPNLPELLKRSKSPNNKPKEQSIWLNKLSKTKRVPLLRLREKPDQPSSSVLPYRSPLLSSNSEELKLPEKSPPTLPEAETELTLKLILFSSI